MPETRASFSRSSGSAACASSAARARLYTAGNASQWCADRLIAALRLWGWPVRSSPSMDSRKVASAAGDLMRPAVLGEIDQIFDMELQGPAKGRVEIDPRVELDRTGRPLRERGRPAFDPVPVHQQDQLRAIIVPDHPGRQRRRQQRRDRAGARLDVAASGPDLRPAADRQLQQKEAIEAARIDRHGTAIGDVVDRKSVERRAVVQRMKIRPGMPEGVERMRTKYPPDQLRGLIDIGGTNPRKRRQPCAGRGTVDT